MQIESQIDIEAFVKQLKPINTVKPFNPHQITLIEALQCSNQECRQLVHEIPKILKKHPNINFYQIAIDSTFEAVSNLFRQIPKMLLFNVAFDSSQILFNLISDSKFPCALIFDVKGQLRFSGKLVDSKCDITLIQEQGILEKEENEKREREKLNKMKLAEIQEKQEEERLKKQIEEQLRKKEMLQQLQMQKRDIRDEERPIFIMDGLEYVVELYKYRGQPVVIQYFSTIQVDAESSIASIKQQSAKYKNVYFLQISTESRLLIDTYYDKHKDINFNIAVDKSGKFLQFLRLYQIQAVPFYVVFNQSECTVWLGNFERQKVQENKYLEMNGNDKTFEETLAILDNQGGESVKIFLNSKDGLKSQVITNMINFKVFQKYQKNQFIVLEYLPQIQVPKCIHAQYNQKTQLDETQYLRHQLFNRCNSIFQRITKLQAAYPQFYFLCIGRQEYSDLQKLKLEFPIMNQMNIVIDVNYLQNELCDQESIIKPIAISELENSYQCQQHALIIDHFGNILWQGKPYSHQFIQHIDKYADEAFAVANLKKTRKQIKEFQEQHLTITTYYQKYTGKLISYSQLNIGTIQERQRLMEQQKLQQWKQGIQIKDQLIEQLYDNRFSRRQDRNQIARDYYEDYKYVIQKFSALK